MRTTRTLLTAQSRSPATLSPGRRNSSRKKRVGSRILLVGSDRATLLQTARNLAAESQATLRRVDLSAVVSKYIG